MPSTDRRTCQHVLEGCGAERLLCGKPARARHDEYGWELCGIHARSWRNRGFTTTLLDLPTTTPARPWRSVAFIGTQVGDQGGLVWRLVLDGCGHTEYRKQPPPRFARQLESILAPKRVVCTSCSFGHPPLDVANAVALAQQMERP